MNFVEHTTEQFNNQIEKSSGDARFIRESAWEAFIAKGLPTRKTENWRYTNLRLLNQPVIEAVSEEINIDELLATIPASFYHVVIIDGVLSQQHTNFDVQWAVDPIVAPIDPAKHPMAVLSLAMTQGGVELTIPAGQVINNPIAIIHVNSGTKENHLNHHINVGEGAKASVVAHYFGAKSAQTVNNILVQVKLQDNAQLNYFSVNTQQSQAILIEGVHAEQQAGSNLNAFVLSTGGRLSRVDINTAYLGTQAQSSMSGVYSVTDKQHTDIHLNAEHIAPHCSTVQSVRGIVDGSAKAVFNGRVCVHKNAIKSYSEQSNHNLILSTLAEVDTKPELEIYNDDVKCAHGATVGQLDQDALFYLLSRGIAKPDALAMLRQAFVNQQFELIKEPAIKDYMVSLYE